MEFVASTAPQLCGQTKKSLGTGGFAEIEVIEENGRDVARKRLTPSSEAWSSTEKLEEERKRFAREIELMMELTHPNIPTIFKGFEYALDEELASVPAYTMPLARESLQQYWEKNEGTDSWPEKADYYLGCMYQVAYTLAFIHSRDTIHRDLKPANILLFDDGTAMLSDFGASKNTNTEVDDKLTRTGLSINTRGFTAPEQLQSLDYATKESDVYSFGATLFYLVTGELAGGPNAKHHLDKLNSAPDPLAEFICKCISFAPSERYSDGTELTLAFHETLGLISEELSIKMYPVPPSYFEALTELLRFGEIKFTGYLATAYTQLAPIGITKFIELISGEVLRNIFTADAEKTETLLQMVLAFNETEYRESQTWVNAERGAKFYRKLLKRLKQHPQQISDERLHEVEYKLAESILHSATLNHRFEAGREFVRLFKDDVGVGEQTLQQVLDSNPEGRKFLQHKVDYSLITLPVNIRTALP